MDFNYRFLKGAIAVITPVFATAHDVNSPKGQPDPGKAMDNENPRSSHLLQLSADSEDEDKFATGSITFVGTATVIIRYGGLTILTDPNFLHQGDHVHLGYGLTSERLTNPAIELENLPPIDLVVLSHMHEDHFDKFVQKNLDRNIPIVTTEEAAKSLKKLGFMKRYPLKTWDTLYCRERQYYASGNCHAGAPRPASRREIIAGSNGLHAGFREQEFTAHLQDVHKR